MNKQANPRRNSWLQVGLKHILLATLLAATWMAYYSNQAKINVMSPQYAQLRAMALELIVRDPSRIAVIALDYNLDVSHSWRVYIPDDGYELCMATRNIGQQGLSADFVKVALPAGNYELGLSENEIEEDSKMVFLKDGIRIAILKDGKPLLETVEPSDWRGSANSSASGHGNISTQYDGRTPIELLRKKYMVQSPASPQSWTSPTTPANGAHIWIQRTEPPGTK